MTTILSADSASQSSLWVCTLQLHSWIQVELALLLLLHQEWSRSEVMYSYCDYVGESALDARSSALRVQAIRTAKTHVAPGTILVEIWRT